MLFLSSLLLTSAEKPIPPFSERSRMIFSSHTGQSLETICQDTERDNFKSAKEARDYGLIDEVLSERVVLPEEESASKIV